MGMESLFFVNISGTLAAHRECAVNFLSFVADAGIFLYIFFFQSSYVHRISFAMELTAYGTYRFKACVRLNILNQFVLVSDTSLVNYSFLFCGIFFWVILSCCTLIFSYFLFFLLVFFWVIFS